MKCSLCESNRMHTSRLRGADIPRIFILQYPVRCRSCMERRYVSLFDGLNLRKSEKLRQQEARRSSQGATDL